MTVRAGSIYESFPRSVRAQKEAIVISKFHFPVLIRSLAVLLLSAFVVPAWAGTVYDGWAAQHLFGPSPAGSQYGSAVAVGGDHAIIGAPYRALDEMFSHGRVDAYVFENGVWQENGILLPDDGHQGLRFGMSVALAGDLAVVGAPGGIVDEVNNGGAGYVFRRIDGNWVQEARLVSNEPISNDSFGNAVAVANDRILIAAETFNVDGQNNAGVVYAFGLTADGWELEARLQAAEPVGAGRFGNALAMDGDRAVIGSSFAVIDGVANGGAVYVFDHDGNEWNEEQRLIPSDHAAHQQFGHATGLSGDRLIVGAPRAAIDGVAFTGAAYIFELGASGWEEVNRMVAADGGSNQSYAESVAVDGDRVLVGGARATIEGVDQAGAAYLYEHNGTDWEQVAKLGAMEPEASAFSNFGQQVGLSENRIVIGQPNLQINSESRGAASLFVPLEEAAFTVSPQIINGLGSTSPAEPQIVPYGEPISFDLLPDPGYHVAEVISSCSGGGLQDETYLVPSVEDNCSISVAFEINPPETAVAVAGSGQQATVNTAFGDVLVVRFLNDASVPVPDVEVIVDSPASGAGAQHPLAGITDENGELEIPVIANSVAGSYTLTFTAESVDVTTSFTLTNTPDVPSQLIMMQGSDQKTGVGEIFPLPLLVQVLDAWNNAIEGVEVNFNSATDGASAYLNPEVATTSAQGIVYSMATANNEPGAHAVVASAAGLEPVEFSLENIGDVQLSATIEVQQAHARYGGVLDFMVTVSNEGGDDAAGVYVEVPVPEQFDPSGMQWVCLMEALDHCAPGGSGAVIDTDVQIPAGGSISYLVAGIVAADTSDGTVHITASADDGTGAALAEAFVTLVLMRDRFEQTDG